MFNKRMMIALMVSFALLLAGCGNDQESAKGKEEKETETVATVNETTITRDELTEMVEQFKTSYTNQGINIEEMSDEEEKQLEKDALDQLVNNELFKQAASDNGFNATSEEVKANLEQLKSQFESEDKFNEALETNNLSIDELEKQLADEMNINNYLESNITEAEVSNEEVQEFYDELAQQANTEEELPELDDNMKEQITQLIIRDKQQAQIMDLLDNLKSEQK